MFIEIDGNIYNSINISSVREVEETVDSSTVYKVITVFKNGRQIIEEYDNKSDADAELEKILSAGPSGGGSTPNLQNKSITITENGTQNVNADTGYDGLENVSITTDVPTGGGIDWTAIGYSEEPDTGIEDGYEYAIEIKNNWRPATSLLNKFFGDTKLKFMPLVDTSTATNMQAMFTNCYVLNTIPQLNTSNVTDMSKMFYNDYNLKNMPLLDTEKVTNMDSMFFSCISLQKILSLDTSNVTNMNSMFGGCVNLINVPQFNTSNVTNIASMFSMCYSLNNISLDNILQMCINAVSYTGTKTLKILGFQYKMTTIYPTSRIEALPHYQDFLDAGWTIGY